MNKQNALRKLEQELYKDNPVEFKSSDSNGGDEIAAVLMNAGWDIPDEWSIYGEEIEGDDIKKAVDGGYHGWMAVELEDQKFTLYYKYTDKCNQVAVVTNIE